MKYKCKIHKLNAIKYKWALKVQICPSSWVKMRLYGGFQSLYRPLDLPRHDCNGWFGGINLLQSSSIVSRLPDCPDCLPEVWLGASVCAGSVCDGRLLWWSAPRLDLGDQRGDLPHRCTQAAHPPLLPPKSRSASMNGHTHPPSVYLIVDNKTKTEFKVKNVCFLLLLRQDQSQSRGHDCFHCVWGRHRAALEASAGLSVMIMWFTIKVTYHSVIHINRVE